MIDTLQPIVDTAFVGYFMALNLAYTLLLLGSRQVSVRRDRHGRDAVLPVLRGARPGGGGLRSRVLRDRARDGLGNPPFAAVLFGLAFTYGLVLSSARC